jgi:predicted O-methyltransferase YrrM
MFTPAQRRILSILAAQRWKHFNVHPELGELLHLLVHVFNSRAPLEIGTANGYSGICIAAALPPGVRLITIERDGKLAHAAAHNFARAGLTDRVELKIGGAFTLLKRLPGPFDFVFMDATKVEYYGYWTRLLPKLAPRCLIVADNVVSHAEETRDFQRAVAEHPEFEYAKLTLHHGVLLAWRGKREENLPSSKLL